MKSLFALLTLLCIVGSATSNIPQTFYWIILAVFSVMLCLACKDSTPTQYRVEHPDGFVSMYMSKQKAKELAKAYGGKIIP